jgi:hypothetical protein
MRLDATNRRLSANSMELSKSAGHVGDAAWEQTPFWVFLMPFLASNKFLKIVLLL